MQTGGTTWADWFSPDAPLVTPAISDALAAIEVGRTLDAEERNPTPAEAAILAKRNYDAEITVPPHITSHDWQGLPPIPIFIIHFNRGMMLQRVIESYQKQTVPVEIIVHDNGSDGPDTLARLAESEKQGIKVVRNPKLKTVADLDNVSATVAAYFTEHAPAPYIVTDCDIELLHPQSIAVYLDLLCVTPQAFVVGPMLRIEDIDSGAPLYNNIMNRNIQAFWRKLPQFTEINGKPVAYQSADIDTTFAVMRPHQKFRRMQPGIRVYAPYDARHLDWYQNEWVDEYQTTSNPNVAHYSNPVYQKEFDVEVLAYATFPKITPQPDGTLQIAQHRILSDYEKWPKERLHSELAGLRKVLADKDRHIENLEVQLQNQAAALRTIQSEYTDSNTWKVGRAALAPIRALRRIIGHGTPPETEVGTDFPSAGPVTMVWTKSGLRERPQ